MKTKQDITALRRMLAKVKAKQETYFQRTGKLLTPFDCEFWALTQTIADLQKP
jgi:hypothetical protein